LSRLRPVHRLQAATTSPMLGPAPVRGIRWSTVSGGAAYWTSSRPSRRPPGAKRFALRSKGRALVVQADHRGDGDGELLGVKRPTVPLEHVRLALKSNTTARRRLSRQRGSNVAFRSRTCSYVSRSVAEINGASYNKSATRGKTQVEGSDPAKPTTR